MEVGDSPIDTNLQKDSPIQERPLLGGPGARNRKKVFTSFFKKEELYFFKEASSFFLKKSKKLFLLSLWRHLMRYSFGGLV